MLPAESRLRTSDEFRAVVRGGVKVARETLVVHALAKTGPVSRAGFVVSKAVGNAVTRNRVKRQLRHLVAPRLRDRETGVDIVVRALPRAASGRLAADFVSAWASVEQRLVTA